MDTPAGQMHVIYRWKSIYVFSETLVRQLSEQLEAEPVNFEFDNVGQAFILDGERDDVVHALESIRETVEKAFRQSEALKRNPAYIPLIQRSKLSEFNVESIVWKEEVDEAESSIKHVKDEEFSHMKYWSPKHGTDYASMIHPRDAEDDVPIMIERICDCRIEKDTFNKRLIIRANDPYVITRVIEKLDKVEEIFNSGITPITSHLVYVNDKQDFELKLVSLKAQLRTTGKTTLFGDKQKRYYRDRKEIFTLRLLRRPDAAAKPTVVPLEIKEIPGNRNGSGPRAWKDYLFKGYGAFENDPAVYVKPMAKVKVQYPVPQVDLQSHALNLQRALGELSLDTNNVFDLGHRPNFGAQQNDESLDFLSGPRPNFARAEESQATPPVAAKRRVKGFEELNTASDSPRMSQAAPPAWPEAEEVVPLPPTAATASSYYDGDFDALLGPRPIAAPDDELLPPRPPTTRQPGVVRTTRRLKAPVDEVPEETVQKVSEADTRVLRNVNAQRKSKKDPIRRYDVKEHEKFNVKTMREVFEPSFDYARLHKCRITFEAKIGRVVYDTAPPATKCMNWDDFLPILDDRRDTMKVFFTDRVTTDFVDVDYVNDLKLDQKQNFFNYAADKKKIWYEFLCDYKGKPCLIKFDAETREMEVLGKLETYGTVMWNCPPRSWDARFTFQARKILNSEDSTFRSLSESLFIPHDCRLPQISFRTEINSLMVKKIYCKRECRYYVLPTVLTGPGRNFEFCVTEVQDLWMRAHTASDETFKASATERTDMIANERLYYAFSLTHSKHEEAFQAQTELEIGEVPQWTGSSMLGPTENGVVEAMAGIITALIERMDDVGYNNQGAWTDGL